MESVRQRGVLSRLSADGGAAEFVIGLVTVRDAVVLSHVLLRLGVASERSETAPPRACFKQDHEAREAARCSRLIREHWVFKMPSICR